MKLSRRGKNILVSVENITPFGIWIFIKGKEYFLSYEEFPREAATRGILRLLSRPAPSKWQLSFVVCYRMRH